MKTIQNTTPGPLRIALGGGKILHLGPSQSGNVADDALRAKGLRRLIESGAVKVAGEEERTDGFAEAQGGPREFAQGHTHPTKIFPTGNRGG
jgi:hypothetical protein